MLRVMLVDLWRRSAWFYVALACLATLAPLRLALAIGAFDMSRQSNAVSVLMDAGGFGILHATLAAMGGLLLGAGVWQSDVSAGHVYALTLPTPRWHYALLRYASGVIVVSGFAMAFWIGCLVATSIVTLPLGVQAYPSALTVRFALTALCTFSLVFTISALTSRTAVVVLLIIAALAIIQIGQVAAGTDWTLLDLFGNDSDWLLAHGRWALFDV